MDQELATGAWSGPGGAVAPAPTAALLAPSTGPSGVGRSDDRSAPSHVKLTWFGWLMLTESLALSTVMFWQPRPFAAILTVAVLVAIGLNAFLGPRHLSRVRAEWVLPHHPTAGVEVDVGAILTARTIGFPMRLEAPIPSRTGTRRYRVVGRLSGVGPVPVRPSWRLRFSHRGLVTLPPLAGRSLQPFGLAETRRLLSDPAEVLVLPARGPLRRQLRQRLDLFLDEASCNQDAGDDQISHLRPYRAGDPRHSIHWRASARHRMLLVGHRHHPQARQVALVVDTYEGGASGRRFERLIAVAASLVVALGDRQWRVSLHGEFAPLGAEGSWEPLLEILALVSPGGDMSMEAMIPRDRPAIVVTCRNTLELPPRRISPLLVTLESGEDLVRLPRMGI